MDMLHVPMKRIYGTRYKHTSASLDLCKEAMLLNGGGDFFHH
ncbi:hypothetical protein OB236_08270 [Paenibacillus sp. WQ 127069]|uniref:Uncharacterized protein n=1 Tax=Paenibacillus baimaensis TaxID=2982185 RepID=A0ABT2UBW0_9BACL|nr:hypothetical protein [Paenibacillus sp. WQ 127069]MCU6792119.1 hypothetical protein [Paenibacillus sp. WQ 127069]